MVDCILSVSTVFPDSLDTVSQIGKNTFDTAENTRFGIIAAITFGITVATFIISLLTYYSQKATQHNTKKMGVEEQNLILLSMVSHLYRSYIIDIAILVKMRNNMFSAYPSEEYMRKMKIDIDGISQYLFYDKNKEDLKKILDLRQKFNDFNILLDVCQSHLQDKTLKKSIKEFDLKCVLGNIESLIITINSIISVGMVFSSNSKSSYDTYATIKKSMAILTEYMKKEAEVVNQESSKNSGLSYTFDDYKKDVRYPGFLSCIFDSFRKDFLLNIQYYLGKKDSGEDIIQMI